MGRIANNDRKEGFSFYDSYSEFQDAIDLELPKTPSSWFYAKKYGGPGGFSQSFLDNMTSFVFGDSSRMTVEQLEKGITEFIDRESLNNLVESVKDLFATIDLGGSFKKDRLIATDRPIGVFSFDLASQGLYRPMEYYSKELDALVDPDRVEKFPGGDFYTKRKIGPDEYKTYLLVQQQEGTFCMARKKQYIAELIAEGYTENEAKNKGRKKFPGCKLVFRTRTKKAYLVRSSKTLSPEQQGKERYVDLFIPIGGLSNQTSKSLMYASLPAFLAAYFLDQVGIKTRINGTLMGSVDTPGKREDERFFTSFVIKDYGDNFDFNQIAILVGDSRFFRWTGFKNIIVEFARLGRDPGNGLGGSPQGTFFDEMFERYKRFYIKQNKTGSIKNANPRLMIKSNYIPNTKRDEEEWKDGAIEEFFRLMDSIDLEFNGAKIAMPRIRDRERKLGNDMDGIRQRLQGVIAKATAKDESDSKYSMTDEEIKSADELRANLRKDLNTVFNQEV